MNFSSARSVLIKSLGSHRRMLWPWLALLLALTLTAYQLRHQGRSWLCSCGLLYPWAGDIWSPHCSQHLLDPYSFTHLCHGLVLCGLVTLAVPRLSTAWRFWAALTLEALWEVIENSEFVIQRYRDATFALGYQGDAVVNSMGDILVCSVGFVLGRYLGLRRSLILFVLTELVLLICIRDSLVLNVVMLICPIDAIKTWQIGR